MMGKSYAVKLQKHKEESELTDTGQRMRRAILDAISEISFDRRENLKMR